MVKKKKIGSIMFHYEPDTDMMRVTRPPHHFSPYALKLTDDINVMVDQDSTKVYGLVFPTYRQLIPEFFSHKKFRGHDCSECKKQLECFERNLQTLLASEIKLVKTRSLVHKILPRVKSDISEKLKSVPKLAPVCV